MVASSMWLEYETMSVATYDTSWKSSSRFTHKLFWDHPNYEMPCRYREINQAYHSLTYYRFQCKSTKWFNLGKWTQILTNQLLVSFQSDLGVQPLQQSFTHRHWKLTVQQCSCLSHVSCPTNHIRPLLVVFDFGTRWLVKLETQRY